MKYIGSLSIVLIILIIIPASAEQRMPTITVLAPTSMTEAMTEIARLYSANYEATISVNFDSSYQLAETISAGEQANIILTDDSIVMRDLKRLGQIDVRSISVLVRNHLALVASKNHHLIRNRVIDDDTSLEDILADINEKALLVMPDPKQTRAGKMAAMALQHNNYWDKIEPFIIREASARGALYLISKGRGAGIVYETDAMVDENVENIGRFPNSWYEPIYYQGAVVASDNMNPARKFLEYLRSKEAMKIFIKYGFEPFRSTL